MSVSAPSRLGRPADRRRLTGAILLVVAVVAVLLAWQRPDPFASHTTVHAIVDDASGLAPIGAEVRVAGTKVGRVTGRKRVGDDAELTLTLDKDVPGGVHADATAALRPRLMFEGTAYVDLTPGSPSAPSLGSRPITRAHTSTYVPLADVLTVLDRRGGASLRGTARGLHDTLSPAVQRSLSHVLGAAPRLTSTLRRTATAARGPHGTELRAVITGFSRATRAIAARASDLALVTDDTTATARALTTEAARPLDATLQRLPATITRLRDGGRALTGTAQRLAPIARDLRPAAARLQPALRAARPLLRAATPALRGAAPVLADLHAGLDSGRRAAAPTRTVLRSLSPTLGILNDSLLGALERKTSLGTPAYLSFLGLFAGGGGASAPFDQHGHFMRFGIRFLTGIGLPLPPCSLLDSASPQLGAALKKTGACTP